MQNKIVCGTKKSIIPVLPVFYSRQSGKIQIPLKKEKNI